MKKIIIRILLLKKRSNGMRIFYYKFMKNLTMIYMISFLVFTYRLTYNAFYCDIHEGIETSKFAEKEVYPSGEIVGIYTLSDGVFVIDTCEIETPEGDFVDPTGDILRSGDYIIAINDEKIESKEQMIGLIQQSEGQSLAFSISRKGEKRVEYLTPVESKSGKYMLGVWIKDDLAGVGTITYVTSEGEFAALGHGMGNGQNKELLEVRGGDVYISEVIGIQKGERGEPGEIKGIIKYGLNNHIGSVDMNSRKGIYGEIDEDDKERYLTEDQCHVCPKQEIEIGTAQIVSEISGERKYYDIEITYVDYLAVNSNKGLHIKVVDVELLELTGGIVQGMSGSPIIQNGKLIGAVTHVLINDPTCGYGIFIEEMME